MYLRSDNGRIAESVVTLSDKYFVLTHFPKIALHEAR